MNSKLKQAKIGQFCNVTSSKRIFEKEYQDFGVPFYRSKEIIELSNNNRITERLYISEKRYNEIVEKFGTIKEGDLLLTSVGTIGVPYIVKESDAFYFKDGNLTWLKDFSKQINSKYLYYYIKSNFGLKSLKNLAIGSSQPALTIDIIKKYCILLPDIIVQNKIVDILQKYDDLIEKDNRKIAILEEQIQELYKEWFVRFRFPGHGKIKYKECSYGRIPIDFEIFKAREVIEDYIGGGWGEEDENIDYNMQAYVIRGTDFERFKQMKIEDIPLRYHKESNLKQRILKAGDFIIEISGGTEEQPVGRICYVTKESLNALLNCAICASFCKSFTINTNIVYPLYFYYFMKTLYDFRALDRYQLQSTGISNFKFEYFLRKCEIIVPPRKLMQLFDEKIYIIMNLINYLYRENNNIRLERDLLLPRLMSGKLKV